MSDPTKFNADTTVGELVNAVNPDEIVSAVQMIDLAEDFNATVFVCIGPDQQSLASYVMHFLNQLEQHLSAEPLSTEHGDTVH